MGNRGGGMAFLTPLRPPEGGPPLAFSCPECKGVTRTATGMRMHLRRKHKIRQQLEMPLPKPEAMEEATQN
jgi:hypothetical protein